MQKYILTFLTLLSVLVSEAQISGPAAVCLNATNTYDAGVVASGYSWYTTPGSIGNFTNATAQTTDFTLTSQVSQYTITVVTSAPTNTFVLTVTNNTQPPPTVNSGSLCEGNSTSLSATGLGTLDWYTTITGGTPFYTGTTYSTPPLFANITYYVEDTYLGCPSIARGQGSVTVNPKPVLNFTGPTFICAGATANINTTVSSGGPVANYFWNPGSYTTQNISVSPAVSTTYTVSVMNSFSCSNSFTRTITVNPLPVMDPVSDLSACAGESVSVSFNANPVSMFNWTNDNINSGLGASGSGNLMFTAANSISVQTSSITVTPTSSFGCVGSPISFSVTVNPNTNIFGTATSTAGVFQADAYLLHFNSAQLVFDTIQTTSLSSNQYTFYTIPAGDYLLKVVPDTANFPDIVPTYYGDAFQWDSATVINHGCIADFTADITMVEVLQTTGTNFIEGDIIEDPGFGTRINGVNHIMVPGGPLKGIDVKLGKNPGSGIQSRTTSDNNGHYSFDSIPAGSYTIYVDIPGLPMDSSYHISLGLTDTLTALNYYADSNSVYPLFTEVGLKPIENNSENSILLFPNPANDVVKINFVALDGNAEISISDITGKQFFKKTFSNLPAAKSELQVKTKEIGLNPGVYLLRVSTAGSGITKKLIITE